MEYVIEVVELEDGKLITSPVVAPGDTVVWFFRNVKGQEFDVKVKENSPIPPDRLGLLQRDAGQPQVIRGEVSLDAPHGDQFNYNIFINRVKRDWAGDENGGCLKTKPPPN